jgi:hypothetical protein
MRGFRHRFLLLASFKEVIEVEYQCESVDYKLGHWRALPFVWSFLQ